MTTHEPEERSHFGANSDMTLVFRELSCLDPPLAAD